MNDKIDTLIDIINKSQTNLHPTLVPIVVELDSLNCICQCCVYSIRIQLLYLVLLLSKFKCIKME